MYTSSDDWDLTASAVEFKTKLLDAECTIAYSAVWSDQVITVRRRAEHRMHVRSVTRAVRDCQVVRKNETR
jgi:hypothetical protein